MNLEEQVDAYIRERDEQLPIDFRAVLSRGVADYYRRTLAPDHIERVEAENLLRDIPGLGFTIIIMEACLTPVWSRMGLWIGP